MVIKSFGFIQVLEHQHWIDILFKSLNASDCNRFGGLVVFKKYKYWLLTMSVREA